MKEKRISFGKFDAERLYEWRLALKQGMKRSCCENCDYIEKRLRKFLGKSSVRLLQQLVRQHPYFVKGKITE